MGEVLCRGHCNQKQPGEEAGGTGFLTGLHRGYHRGTFSLDGASWWAPGWDSGREMSCLGFSVLLFLAFSLCRIRLPSGCGERPGGSSFAVRPQFPDTLGYHVRTGSFVSLNSVASQVSSTFHHGRELDLLLFHF